MTESTAAPPSPESQFADKTLYRAWEVMFEYDAHAISANRNFKRTRAILIGVTVSSTILAALATVLSDLQNQWVFRVFAIVAFSLPIVGNGIVTYIQRFGRVEFWLKHRVICERMRSEIYLYRMRAGHYAEIEPVYLNEKLNELIHSAEKFINAEDMFITEKNNRKPSVHWSERLKKYGDDGQSMTFEAYLKIRGEGQRNWYASRLGKNYRIMRSVTTWALVIQVLGSLVAGLALFEGFDPRLILVATVTNAISTGLNTWVTVALTGQVYGIFNIARKELSQHLGMWDAFSDNPESQDADKTRAKQIEIVTAIERTLAWEREEWYRVALQTLSSQDQALFQAVEELHKRDDDDKQDKP